MSTEHDEKPHEVKAGATGSVVDPDEAERRRLETHLHSTKELEDIAAREAKLKAKIADWEAKHPGQPFPHKDDFIEQVSPRRQYKTHASVLK